MPIARKDMELIDSVAGRLAEVRRVLFVTGAGISADSGLPTYRGIGGLYNSGLTADGITIEDAISGGMMASRPSLPWKYLTQMEQACRNAEPNAAHRVIADMESVFDRVTVLTQNIDGLHQKAGSQNVIDIHGDLRVLVCTACDWESRVETYEGLGDLPRCPECGDVIRPAVVLFGERLPEDKCERIMDEWREGFDMVFSVGTTSVFPYISQPVMYAGHYGIPTVEINPGTTHVSHLVDTKILARAAETLEQLWRRYNE